MFFLLPLPQIIFVLGKDRKMASVDLVRQALMKAAKDYDPSKRFPSKSVNSNSLLPLPKKNLARKTNFVSFESRLLNSFHRRDPISNQISIAKFVTADTGCMGFVMIRLLDNDLFRIYFRGTTPCSGEEIYNLDYFTCIQTVLSKKDRVIQSDDDNQALSLLVQWKPLFTIIPDVVLAIPVINFNDQVMAVVALAFKKKIPPDFLSHKFEHLKESLHISVPYAMTLQALHDNIEQNSRHQVVLEALEVLDETLMDSDKCMTAIGIELGKLTSCSNIIIFTVDSADKRLQKWKMFGKQKSSQWGCPDSGCHEEWSFPIDEKQPVGWVATYKKGIKLNDSSECSDYNLSKKGFHSVGSCFCKNVLCVPVGDLSFERPLVIELSDKEGGFSVREFKVALLFAEHVTYLLTCSAMLRHRQIASGRNSIVSRILLNIETISDSEVKQVLHHQQEISGTAMFEGQFLDFSYSIKNHTELQMAAVIFHTFTDLDLMSTFKIRRTNLVRFILSVKQGYRPLPYHNWQHACSVTHFLYLLIKNLQLVELEYLTQLECLALVVSGLVHDIDHRGTNNRFQACTNSDLYQLYDNQDSVMEKHHLAIGISILQQEGCNILENLSEEDYEYFVKLLTWNVLATDIAKYLQTRETHFKLIRSLRKHHEDDKLALLSLVMTASDVNECVKSWQDNLNSVRQILTEFFDQGKMEKDLGLVPMAMMDRDKAYIPEVEYNFISGIVLPVYKELAAAFPELNVCVQTLEKYEDNWEVSTSIFDTEENLHRTNKLEILQFPEMMDENLELLRASLDKTGDRDWRFSKENKARPTTADPKGRLAIRDSIAPAQDFRQMFTEKDSPVEENETTDVEVDFPILEEKRTGCCGCFRKKHNDPDQAPGP